MILDGEFNWCISHLVPQPSHEIGVMHFKPAGLWEMGNTFPAVFEGNFSSLKVHHFREGERANFHFAHYRECGMELLAPGLREAGVSLAGK